MKIKRAYKVELNPNNKQRTMFRKCAGTARFVYNWGLVEWKRQYEAGEKPSHYGLRKQLSSIKDAEFPWIREMPYAVMDSALCNLGLAFKNFFRRVKNGDEKPGYPRFKKKGRDDSFQLRSTRIERDRARLTHIGWVRLKERGYIPMTDSGVKFGTYATISRCADRWFISIQIEEEIPEPKNGNTFALGVDFGLKALAVCSDGVTFENPYALQQEEYKLKRLSKELSRRKRGGQNWKKTKAKIQRCHARIANIRKHALHQVSHHVTAKTKPKTIVLEDLNVSGMLQNRHLSKAISDVGFYELRRQTEYKAQWHGIEVIIADRFYPSSKTCSECGAVKPLLKLSERTFVCEACGAIVDRDLNAAMNLAALAEGGNTAGLPVELGCSNASL
jgi:putative transposase